MSNWIKSTSWMGPYTCWSTLTDIDKIENKFKRSENKMEQTKHTHTHTDQFLAFSHLFLVALNWFCFLFLFWVFISRQFFILVNSGSFLIFTIWVMFLLRSVWPTTFCHFVCMSAWKRLCGSVATAAVVSCRPHLASLTILLTMNVSFIRIVTHANTIKQMDDIGMN